MQPLTPIHFKFNQGVRHLRFLRNGWSQLINRHDRVLTRAESASLSFVFIWHRWAGQYLTNVSILNTPWTSLLISGAYLWSGGGETRIANFWAAHTELDGFKGALSWHHTILFVDGRYIWILIEIIQALLFVNVVSNLIHLLHHNLTSSLPWCALLILDVHSFAFYVNKFADNLTLYAAHGVLLQDRLFCALKFGQIICAELYLLDSTVWHFTLLFCAKTTFDYRAINWISLRQVLNRAFAIFYFQAAIAAESWLLLQFLDHLQGCL